jgi:ethanolamine utilization protein EutA
MNDDTAGGRVFFSNTGRSLTEEDQICVLSVGVDIGSSTSHLAFSRVVLERLDARYVVTEREVFFESDIMLTPYASGQTIDADALGRFISEQYALAQVDPDEIDTGALILTGVAVERSNARRIGELFARRAGNLVAVSAGDSLETIMAAYGSGAVARSIREKTTVMNVDVGGGTSKIAICADGRVREFTALDVGARLVCVDEHGRINRIEAAGFRFATELGLDLKLGATLPDEANKALAGLMADKLFEAMAGGSPAIGGTSLLRLAPLGVREPVPSLTFSGGVSEYIYERETAEFGDLGPFLAAAIREHASARLDRNRLKMVPSGARIRATVIGASQYTSQVSGSTIYAAPLDTLPLRNVPVITPQLALDEPTINPADISLAVAALLRQMGLDQADSPIAVFLPWRGSATFQRLDGVCRGIIEGLAPVLERGHPLVLVGDGDVGGLIGIHCHQELKLTNAVVSVDGLELQAFDYIDIGAMLPTTGAVPVVIKSLIFPSGANVAHGKTVALSVDAI